MALLVYAALGVAAGSGLLLTAVWAYYFKAAAHFCEEIGSMGNGEFALPTKGLAWNSEPCEFTTTDGVGLQGSYLRTFAPERLGVIVFCHEYRADRSAAVAYLNELCEDGFDVFSFDFRNHGESEAMGEYSPRAWPTIHEVTDVLAAVDYLASRDDADPNGVALLGVSKGGVAALSAASRTDKVWAVVTDGAFVVPWVMGYNIRRFLPRLTPLAPLLQRMPWFLFTFYGSLIQRYVAKRAGHVCPNLLADARKLQQPVLLIHGERDRTIPADFTPKLRKQIGGNCKVWIVPRARHNEAVYKEPKRYHRTVRRFLLKQLDRDIVVQPAPAGPQLSEVDCATKT